MNTAGSAFQRFGFLKERNIYPGSRLLSVYKRSPGGRRVAFHATFYVARPFPSHVKPAQVLEENDYHYLRGLLFNRGSYPNVPGVGYRDSSETRLREG